MIDKAKCMSRPQLSLLREASGQKWNMTLAGGDWQYVNFSWPETTIVEVVRTMRQYNCAEVYRLTEGTFAVVGWHQRKPYAISLVLGGVVEGAFRLSQQIVELAKSNSDPQVQRARDLREQIKSVIVGLAYVIFGTLAGTFTYWEVAVVPVALGVIILLSPVFVFPLTHLFQRWRTRKALHQLLLA